MHQEDKVIAPHVAYEVIAWVAVADTHTGQQANHFVTTPIAVLVVEGLEVVEVGVTGDELAGVEQQALDMLANRDIAGQKGERVSVARRFDPHFRAVRAEIDAGTIGAVEQVVITSRDPGAPPAEYITRSGGIFRDMTIHDFDMARFLLGEEIAAVTAVASVLVDPKIGELGDFDSVSVILATASGKQCLIGNSRRATYGYDQRIEVLGTLGQASVGNMSESLVVLSTVDGIRGEKPLHNYHQRYAQAYRTEILAFVQTVASGGTTSPDATDGLRASAIAEAAILSMACRASVAIGAE